MDAGTIELDGVPGGLDLYATLESGQTYLWWRSDGRTYADARPAEDVWYLTTIPPSRPDGPGLLRVRQRGERLEWEATVDAAAHIRRRLRLDDDLPAIRDDTPRDALVDRAYDAHWGMRLVEEPVFPTLISFICSAQMRVERIFEMQRTLRRALGQPMTVDGETYHAYPQPAALATTSEERFRDLGLGYRAPYVRETARLVAEGEVDLPAAGDGRSYEATREALTAFVGVGDKVADCVCLFALDHREAVPLDTWIRGAIEDHYPACARGSYADTSAAIREQFGGSTAGYAQTYVFHHLRTGAENSGVAADD